MKLKQHAAFVEAGVGEQKVQTGMRTLNPSDSATAPTMGSPRVTRNFHHLFIYSPCKNYNNISCLPSLLQ